MSNSQVMVPIMAASRANHGITAMALIVHGAGARKCTSGFSTNLRWLLLKLPLAAAGPVRTLGARLS